VEGEGDVPDEPLFLGLDRLADELLAALVGEEPSADAVEVIVVQVVDVELAQLDLEQLAVALLVADRVLAGDLDLVAPALQRFADHAFALLVAVHPRRVDVVDAELERPVDERDGEFLVDSALGLCLDHGEAHGAEAKSRNVKSCLSEGAVLHGSS